MPLEHVHQAAQEALRIAARKRRQMPDPAPLNERFTIYAVYHWHVKKRRWDLIAFTKTVLQKFPSQRHMDRLRKRITRKTKKWRQEEGLIQIGELFFKELSLAARHGPPIEAPRDELRLIRRRLAERNNPRHAFEVAS